ncbi:hypothetical protein [Microvirga sp. P5_D2]
MINVLLLLKSFVPGLILLLRIPADSLPVTVMVPAFTKVFPVPKTLMPVLLAPLVVMLPLFVSAFPSPKTRRPDELNPSMSSVPVLISWLLFPRAERPATKSPAGPLLMIPALTS